MERTEEMVHLAINEDQSAKNGQSGRWTVDACYMNYQVRKGDTSENEK